MTRRRRPETPIADSIDFLEDTALNLLILIGLKWNARNRARHGMILSVLLLVPEVATLWTAWRKFTAPVPPLALAARGILLVILSRCAREPLIDHNGRLILEGADLEYLA